MLASFSYFSVNNVSQNSLFTMVSLSLSWFDGAELASSFGTKRALRLPYPVVKQFVNTYFMCADTFLIY